MAVINPACLVPSLRIIYAGTPEFAVPALQALHASEHTVVSVLTQPDRPAGRGRRLQSSPVKQAATAAGLPVWQPATLKDSDVVEKLRAQTADLMIVTAYGLLLPAPVLAVPQHGCWNIHASLLPRWRGAAPIQRALAAGDAQTGITIMQMDTGLDTGPMLAQSTLNVGSDDTSASLHDSLAQLGAVAVLDCVKQLAAGQPPVPQPQDDSLACYAPRLSKAEAQIDWQLPAAVIERQVRAFNPWPVSWTMLAGKRTRIWAAQTVTGAFGAPGHIQTAASGELIIACAEDALSIQQLQPEGSRVMTAQDWLNAHGRWLASRS